MTAPADAFDCSANAVLDRLKDRLSLAQDLALAARFDVPKANVSTWRRRNHVPYVHVVRVCAAEGIDIDWILTGRWSPWTPGRIMP